MSELSAALEKPVQAALHAAGDETPIRAAQEVTGGCINNATRLVTEKRSYLLKWNPRAKPEAFQQEILGLRLLAATQTVRVPAVYANGMDFGANSPAFLLLEWLEPSGSADPARLGEQLAALHHHDRIPAGLTGFTAPDIPAYGLDHDNNIGGTPQINTWNADWAGFFVTCRIIPQMQMAERNGRLSGQRRENLERLITRIPDLLRGPKRQPALIHGDLWSGNVIPGPGCLALIDPAVSFSDREAELAYTELFGGFSPRFYEAYQHVWPLDPGYTERRDLYNLYHLLNHLNLFGEGYGSGVDSVLRRYL